LAINSASSYATIYREVSSSGHVTFTDSPSDDPVSSSIVIIKQQTADKTTDLARENRLISPNKDNKTITRPDDLQNLTADFDDAILDNWLSSYWDCTNHFQRVDFQHKKFLQFFSQNSPLVIPIVNRNDKSLKLYYSENIKYELDTKQKVLLSYRNNAKPQVLYICAEDDVPQHYKNRFDTYLINQIFLAGHGKGPNLDIKDGAKFLDQECRLTYEDKEYKNARGTCALAATNDNNVAAKYHLGMLYRFNTGGNIDYQTSYKHTLAAANAGFSPAFSWLAWHYEFGKGLTPNYAEALRWRIAAVDAGHMEAAKSIAKYYMQGLGVETDHVQAAVWLLIAARGGDSHAQNMLGCMYANGVGLEQNYELAYHWINKSKQQNNPKALFNLAMLYEQDKIIKDGKGSADALYERARQRGITRTSDIIDKYDRVWAIE